MPDSVGRGRCEYGWRLIKDNIQLYLSLHTVKVHACNIYGMLGVRNRTEAVARGQSVGHPRAGLMTCLSPDLIPRRHDSRFVRHPADGPQVDGLGKAREQRRPMSG